MDDQSLYKTYLIGAIAAAALLLAPYFGLRLLRDDASRDSDRRLNRPEAARPSFENAAASRSRYTPRADTAAQSGRTSSEHALSEVEELLK